VFKLLNRPGFRPSQTQLTRSVMERFPYIPSVGCNLPISRIHDGIIGYSKVTYIVSSRAKRMANIQKFKLLIYDAMQEIAELKKKNPVQTGQRRGTLAPRFS